MQAREIARNEWQGYFDQVSRALRGKLIQIEIDSLKLGAQIEVNTLSLNGLTYDKKDNSFIVSTDEIEHVIRSPEQIFVTDGATGMDSLKVHSADGVDQIISFSEPLALPTASSVEADVSKRAIYERKMQAQLDELKAEIVKIKTKAMQTEANLQLEYYTQIEELQSKLATVEQSFQRFRQVHDDSWEEFKLDLERNWTSLQGLIKAITSP